MNISLFPNLGNGQVDRGGVNGRHQPIKLDNALHLGRPRKWVADLGGHLREQ